MKSWHLIVDVARCHDCNDCFLADKDEFVDNEFPPYSAAQPWHGHRWMNIKRKERGQYPLVETAYLPMPCMHCDAAPCLTADGAVYKRPDGLVIIDPVKAKGRKEIVASCPYSVIYWNEEKELAAEVHRLRPPARRRLDRDALQPGVPDRGHQVRDGRGGRLRAPGRGRGPRALPRLARHRAARLVQEPAPLGEGVRRRAASSSATPTSAPRARASRSAARAPRPSRAPADIFGEVKVDHLEPGHEYTVSIEADGYQPAEMTVRVDASLNAGTVVLQKA